MIGPFDTFVVALGLGVLAGMFVLRAEIVAFNKTIRIMLDQQREIRERLEKLEAWANITWGGR